MSSVGEEEEQIALNTAEAVREILYETSEISHVPGPHECKVLSMDSMIVFPSTYSEKAFDLLVGIAYIAYWKDRGGCPPFRRFLDFLLDDVRDEFHVARIMQHERSHIRILTTEQDDVREIHIRRPLITKLFHYRNRKRDPNEGVKALSRTIFYRLYTMGKLKEDNVRKFTGSLARELDEGMRFHRKIGYIKNGPRLFWFVLRIRV